MVHPTSPYVLGYVFRKHSFLHSTKPRQCQPALLAGMLWVAAQTCDAQVLTSTPSARSKVCQKLLELTISLLKPLIHTPVDKPASGNSIDSVAATLGGLGVTLSGPTCSGSSSGDNSLLGATGTLDDVVTYIHLATLASASEYKGSSLRWWTAAWSLARELKLNRELPAPSHYMLYGDEDVDADAEGEDDIGSALLDMEQREERRRVWWLAYIVDRHLSLCYNQPLFLLDRECEGLLRPMNDVAWQSGNFETYTPLNPVLGLNPEGHDSQNSAFAEQRGSSYECTSHSIFGYFLPLMTILGEIADLRQSRNHPKFGPSYRSSQDCANQISSITHHLDIYERSLSRFEKTHLNPDHPDHRSDVTTPSMHSAHTPMSSSVAGRIIESDIQTHIVTAYGMHVLHVLHVLLADKWDPVDLLDDADQWISTPAFVAATSHAVSAAEAIGHIMEFDPGLEFMPFFFGIYLLQGSFLLLLIANKLQPQADAPAPVVKACETIVRAHEACVVTLSTEYQRNFNKVMRSALAQIRGRTPVDVHELQQRRRELLLLYRWTVDGTGLAL